MKQIYGIVFLLSMLSSTCLALPTKPVPVDVNKQIEVESLKELKKTHNKSKTIEENPPFTVEILEIPIKANNSTYLKSLAKEDENKIPCEDWKDLANDFLPLKNRLPDLTDEEYDEINKEGATPINFLKNLQVKKYIKDLQSKQISTPIFITVPIVINGHSSLPLALTIGGQNIPLNIADNVRNSTSKIKDHNEKPIRQTNCHRSNLRKKIYAHNNDPQNVEFLGYKE